jgi:hypothetical protein
MTELSLLRILLLVSMLVGPLGTHRVFLPPSRARAAAHAIALACAAVGMFYVPILCVVWLGFCATTFAQFLWARRTSLSLHVFAASVPFVFSNVAASWIVGGANDLQILGYDVYFSYYAALHGNVLGWIVIGAIAILAEPVGPRRTIYVASVFTCLPSFLLIAFGIDQLAVLKPIGVVGLSIALPIAQLAFLRDAWVRDRLAFALGCISAACLVFTMVLAWRNELAMPAFLVAGIRGIVSVHGTLNALVTAPCFLLAVLVLRGRAPKSL